MALDGADYTLLAAPMGGFYTGAPGERPGATQLRLAMVESPEKMARVPAVFAALLRAYTSQAAAG